MKITVTLSNQLADDLFSALRFNEALIIGTLAYEFKDVDEDTIELAKRKIKSARWRSKTKKTSVEIEDDTLEALEKMKDELGVNMSEAVEIALLLSIFYLYKDAKRFLSS